jgi:hypothetical protein
MLNSARKHKAGAKPTIVGGPPPGALSSEEADVIAARGTGAKACAARLRVAQLPEQRKREVEHSLQAKGYS